MTKPVKPVREKPDFIELELYQYNMVCPDCNTELIYIPAQKKIVPLIWVPETRKIEQNQMHTNKSMLFCRKCLTTWV